MRAIHLCLVACFWLPFVSASSAGIYSPGDEMEQPSNIQKPLTPREFRQRLAVFGSLAAMPPGQPTKDRYLGRRRALETLVREGRASNDDRMALSAIMMRLGENAQAISLLRDAPLLVRSDPLAAAQLSTLMALEGKYEDAATYCRQALEAWPAARAPYTPAQLKSSKRAEQYCLRFYRSRALERAKGATNVREPDDLFGLRFATSDAMYGPGRLAAEEQKKLPDDALGILEQMLLWMPSDTRLYWQYAELLNARGDPGQAAQVMDECLWNRRYDAPLLRQHRQILREAITQSAKVGQTVESGDVALRLPEPGPAASWHVDRGLVVAVGVLAAMVVVYLAYQQVRESRRKRLR
jgi:tetratricopeptide (TPR) repeat protein